MMIPDGKNALSRPFEKVGMEIPLPSKATGRQMPGVSQMPPYEDWLDKKAAAAKRVGSATDAQQEQ